MGSLRERNHGKSIHASVRPSSRHRNPPRRLLSTPLELVRVRVRPLVTVTQFVRPRPSVGWMNG